MSGDRLGVFVEGAGFGPCAACGAPGLSGLGLPKADPKEKRRFLWVCGERHLDIVAARIRALWPAEASP